MFLAKEIYDIALLRNVRSVSLVLQEAPEPPVGVAVSRVFGAVLISVFLHHIVELFFVVSVYLHQ